MALVFVFSCGIAQATPFSDAKEHFETKNFVRLRIDLFKLTQSEEYRDNYKVLSMHGWSEFMLDNFLGAHEAFMKLHDLSPKNFDANLGLAWTNIKLGRLDEADPYLDAALKKAEDWQRYMIYDARGWQAAKRGDEALAEKFFKKEKLVMVAGQKKEDDPKIGLGWLYLNRGDLKEAKKQFAEGLKRKKKCFFCNDGLARIALAEKKLDEALKHAVEGNKKVNLNSGMISLLGTILFQINDPEITYEAYSTLAKVHDDSAVFRALGGYGELAIGKTKEAEASFLSALEMSPYNATALAGLNQIRINKTALVKDGWDAYYKGEYENALSAFEGKLSLAKSNSSSVAEEGRGWSLIALGKPKDAFLAFSTALKIDAGSPNARSGMIAAERASLGGYTRAWNLMTAGDLDGAAKSFNLTRKNVSSSSMWLIDDGLAWIDYFKGESAKAEAQFKSILNANPDAYLSRKGLGLISLANNDFDGATKHLSASFTANPFQLLSSYTTPAQTMLDNQQYSQAIKILELGQQAYPYSADIQFQLAKGYLGLKDTASALKKAVIAAQLAPTYISPVFETLKLNGNNLQDAQLLRDAYLAMAAGLFAAGDSENALRRYDQYFQAGGDQQATLIGVAWSQLILGRIDEAENTFKRLRNSGDENLVAIADMGMAFVELERGAFDRSVPFLKELLKTNPYQLLSLYNRAGVKLIEAKKPQMAVDILSIGETIYPLSADLQALLASAFKSMGDDNSAATRLIAAARLAPTYMNAGFNDLGLNPASLADAYYAMAWGNYFAKNNEGAVFRFNEYMKAGGADPNAVRGRGFAQYRMGKLDEAKVDLIKAATNEPETLLPVTEVVPLPGVGQSWTVVYNAQSTLAWIAFHQGKNDQAEVAFAKVLDSYPMLVDAHTGMGYAQLAQGKMAEAKNSFQAALKVSPYYPDALRGMEQIADR